VPTPWKKNYSHQKTTYSYISVLSLTFEIMVVDFTPIYGQLFKHQRDSIPADFTENFYKHIGDWEAWNDSLSSLLLPTKGFIREQYRKL